LPTYEYSCRDCGEHLEVVQSFKDDALTTCPNCGGSLRKVFGAVGIVFKGSGFYKTDNRSKGNRASSPASEPSGDGASKESPAAASGTSGSGTETKTDSPSPAAAAPASSSSPAPTGTTGTP